MKPAPAELGSPLAGAIQRFVAQKRALNRRYDTEEQALRLLDRYLVKRSITDLAGVTPDVLSAFLSSRPRSRFLHVQDRAAVTVEGNRLMASDPPLW